MPNRMLRDWTASDKINTISVHAERFFVRLIMKVDDYGCFHANPSLLKAALYPLLLDSIREADMSRWMTECQKAGLVVLYESEGKKYLQIRDFRQRLDKARSKYPLPIVNDFREVGNEFPAEREPEEEDEIEKEKKKKADATAPGVELIFKTENFRIAWERWKAYKLKEHRFAYKSPESERAALEKLNTLAAGAEENALAIIKQSIASGWKGFFELKNQSNGGNQQVITNRSSGNSGSEKLGTSAARIDAAKKW